MKIVTVLGTRPEIIKLSPLLELFNKNFDHIIIHTGQHYDPELDSDIFRELKLPNPSIKLKTGSGNFAEQINLQIKGIYDSLVTINPDYVIVQGDTNTSLCGALVARRLKYKVIHLEAGCRSGNFNSPEEQNRKAIDSISNILLCSDKNALKNLKKEGKSKISFLVGSTTFDAIKRSYALASKNYMKDLGLKEEKFVLVTLHRAENMEDLRNFEEKINFLNWISDFTKVIFPIHPRTKKFMDEKKISLSPKIIQTGPLGHLNFISLLSHSRLVISDSGGIQEEAAAFDRPCLILRNETEWMRLVKAGKNFLFPKLTKTDYQFTQKLLQNDKFYRTVRSRRSPESVPGASKKIVSLIKKLSKLK